MERFTETDCSKCGVPVNVDLDPQGDLVRYDDAQRALDAEREKVKALERELADIAKGLDPVEVMTKGMGMVIELQNERDDLQAQLRQVEGEPAKVA